VLASTFYWPPNRHKKGTKKAQIKTSQISRLDGWFESVLFLDLLLCFFVKFVAGKNASLPLGRTNVSDEFLTVYSTYFL
jgi:hypothetical protein